MMSRKLFVSLAALIAVAGAAGAQPQAVRSSLPASLDAATRATIELVADSARIAGLPVEPLFAKAAEGKLKGATDAEIVTAVRALARRFGEVRAALGPRVDGGVMGAAATALRVGVPMETIRRLAAASVGARDANADLALALVTLADLIDQRVPIAPAFSSVESLLARHATDGQYTRLRLDVQADIVAGRSPESSVRTRTEAIVRTLPPLPPRGSTDPRF